MPVLHVLHTVQQIGTQCFIMTRLTTVARH
jgi:hypothetical protein